MRAGIAPRASSRIKWEVVRAWDAPPAHSRHKLARHRRRLAEAAVLACFRSVTRPNAQSAPKDSLQSRFGLLSARRALVGRTVSSPAPTAAPFAPVAQAERFLWTAQRHVSIARPGTLQTPHARRTAQAVKQEGSRSWSQRSTARTARLAQRGSSHLSVLLSAASASPVSSHRTVRRGTALRAQQARTRATLAPRHRRLAWIVPRERILRKALTRASIRMFPQVAR